MNRTMRRFLIGVIGYAVLLIFNLAAYAVKIILLSQGSSNPYAVYTGIEYVCIIIEFAAIIAYAKVVLSSKKLIKEKELPSFFTVKVKRTAKSAMMYIACIASFLLSLVGYYSSLYAARRAEQIPTITILAVWFVLFLFLYVFVYGKYENERIKEFEAAVESEKNKGKRVLTKEMMENLQINFKNPPDYKPFNLNKEESNDKNSTLH